MNLFYYEVKKEKKECVWCRFVRFGANSFSSSVHIVHVCKRPHCIAIHFNRFRYG